MESASAPDKGCYRAIDIARESGQTSDKWTRNKRKSLEDMLSTCQDSHLLVDDLKVRGGYSRFALDLIVEYAFATGSMLPVTENGQIQRHANGVVKLRQRAESDPERLSDAQYQEILWKRYGRAEQPEPQPELELEQDEFPVTDIVSTRLEFVGRDRTPLVAEALDATATLAGDTSYGLAGMMQHLLHQDREAGRMFGALRARQFAAGMQETMNSAVADIAKQSEVESAPSQGVTRRTKR